MRKGNKKQNWENGPKWPYAVYIIHIQIGQKWGVFKWEFAPPPTRLSQIVCTFMTLSPPKIQSMFVVHLSLVI